MRLVLTLALMIVAAFFFTPTRTRMNDDAPPQDARLGGIGDECWNCGTTRVYGASSCGECGSDYRD